MKLLKLFGSLTLAILLISALALVLIISTTLESVYGTPFAQRLFYQAGWFDVLLGLFFVNIFCATLTRWPFKKYHTGFVVTHIGILMVLIGSLQTRLYGVDGQLTLGESDTNDLLIHAANQIVVHKHGAGEPWTQTFNPGDRRGKRGIPVPGTGATFEVDDIIEDAVESSEIVEGGAQDPANAAVRFELSSERAGLSDTLTLSQKNPFVSEPDRLSMGPATLTLKTKRSATPAAAVTAPSVRIEDAAKGGSLTLELSKLPAGTVKLDGTDIVLSDFRYYPDARVDGSKLISISDEPRNPAVEFKASNAAGRVEKHTRFALFPDFESMHGKSREESLGLSVEILMPEEAQAPGMNMASMTIYAINGQWSFESKNKSGAVTTSALEAGKTYGAGWMDFKIKPLGFFERARFERRVRPAGGAQKGELAVKVSVRENGKVLASDWLTSDRPFQWDGGGAPITAVLQQKHSTLPFKLTLNDFRKVDYPGTNSAASYESDVTLIDEKDGISMKKTISMNKPLDYKGFRIFQSSFAQDPSGIETSIFTVAKSPGVFCIYVGSVILFAGVVIIFYITPLSSFSPARKGARK